MLLAVARKVHACPYCGSTRITIVDGHLVCTNCGAVIDDTVFYYGVPYQLQGSEEERRRARSLIQPTTLHTLRDGDGLEIASFLYRLGLSTERVTAVLKTLYSNECLRTVVERIKDKHVAALLLLMVYGYLVEGSHYLPSTLTSSKNVKRRLQRYYKTVIERCFDGARIR